MARPAGGAAHAITAPHRLHRHRFAHRDGFAAAQAPVTPAREPIAFGATTAQRNEAARVLVPLLRDVRRRAQRPVEVRPGTVPNSPFAGTQTTLFAFSVSERSVPVDTRVVAAMDRLITWPIDEAVLGRDRAALRPVAQ